MDPVEKVQVQDTQVQKVKTEEDITTRVAQYKLPEVNPSETIAFNVDDIAKIQDPTAKELVEKAYKSMQGDYTRKTQSLSEKVKSYEQKQLESEQWTPERVQTLLQNQQFVTSAQAVASQQPEIDPDVKKAQDSANAANRQVQLMLIKQQDDALKAKYTSYDSDKIEKMQIEINQGKHQNNIRELVHKALDYESAQKRAYALGKEDKKPEIADKVQSSAADGLVVKIHKDAPVREKNQTSKKFLHDILTKNFSKS